MTPMEILRAAAARTVGAVAVQIAVKTAGVFAASVAVLAAIVSDSDEPGFSETNRTQYMRRTVVMTCVEVPPVAIRTGDRASYDGETLTVQAVGRSPLGLPQITASRTRRVAITGGESMTAEGEA